MVKVSIRIRSGAARFDVATRAESIGQAVGIVRDRYPGYGVRVTFPIVPEGFFVKDPAAPAGMVGFAQPDQIAA